MDFATSLIVLSQLLLIIIEKSLSENCVYQTACSCKTSKYTLDFSTLGKGSNPRFKDIKDPDKPKTTSYSYQPCVALPADYCGDGSVNAAVCQSQAGMYVAGDAANPDPTFSGDAEQKTLKITYTTNDGSDRRSIVSLLCGAKEDFQSQGEGKGEDKKHYYFTLTSPLLCPYGPPNPGGGGKSGLSTGSVLLIIFFVLLIVYFIVGAVFLKYRRGAEGEEMIPNLEFWKALPGLIKDGTLFVFRGCKTDSSYSQI